MKMVLLNEEEMGFLIGALEHIKEDLDMADAMEYGDMINDLLDKLEYGIRNYKGD